MPTLSVWQDALVNPRSITVDSTQNLADAVNGRPKSASFNDEPKLATRLEEFSPPREIQIVPVQLLHALGRITSPRIDNLADLCSTWAKIRYIWAFDIGARQLKLSEDALNIDFHQKALLSDEIGVGMAALLLEQYFNAQNPVDVDVALRDELIGGLEQRYRTSPDYIFSRPNGDYIVVECKGTRCGRVEMLDQLKRGTEQVPSLAFQEGNNPQSLVVGTRLFRRRTEVYIVDPPSEGSSRKREIKDVSRLRHTVGDAQRASLFQFIGANGRANDLLPHERKSRANIRYEPPDKKRLSDLAEDYVGISQTVNLIGETNRLRVFQGVPTQLYQALEQGNWGRVYDLAGRVYHKATTIRRNQQQGGQPILDRDRNVFTIEQAQNHLMVRSFDQDGTVLEIEVGQ